jgi:asparagine synthase (glutamine-hydrolysing)
MCGICGYIASNSFHRDNFTITKMISTLEHRGPDNKNYFLNDNVALGHTRLSILDLSSEANQPMQSQNGNFIIVYNGELYNYRELRHELLQRGYIFNTNTDTEVVLNGYDAWGDNFFIRMNGIFSFAIWNQSEKELTIVRDRFGVKPLYYSYVNGDLVFASEIKALLASNLISASLNYESLHEFLYYGNPIGSKTLFKGIKKLKPGNYIKLSNNKIKEFSYWNFNLIKERVVNENDAIDDIKYLFDAAIKRQLVSDVPVGVFLSGGIDSTCITAFAVKHYQGTLSTYSCAFDFDLGVNELAKARKVAKFYGTNHNELFIEGKNIGDVVSNLIHHHDEPFSDAANIPLYLLSKSVSKYHKVILQGDGGDELFGGYRRYNTLNNYNYWKFFSPIINGLISFFPKSPRTKQYSRFLEAMMQNDDAMRMALLLTVETIKDTPIEIFNSKFKKILYSSDPFSVYKQINSNLTTLNLVQKMLLTDMQVILPETFLEKVDKSTMANSVEVRVPFLDNDLAEYVMSLPSTMKIKHGQKKYILRRAMRGIVPDYILDAPKTGFGVPFGNWLKSPLRNYMLEVFNDPYIVKLEIFDYSKLNNLIQLHLNNKQNNGFLLWKLLNLCIWLKSYKVNLDD